MSSQGLVGGDIAIVDDDPEAIKMAEVELLEGGFNPIIVDGPIDSCKVLVSYLSDRVNGVLCDHRLGFSGFANFSGAELVANLFDIRIPAILVTQYTDIDKDVSIRKWRRKIPVLFNRDEVSARRIQDGFIDCRRELSGQIRPDRKPYRALVRISEINNESSERVLDAVIPSWNPKRAVRFPISLLPSDLRSVVSTSTRLIAYINIGAKNSEDLYFDQFEIAPEIRENDIFS